MGCKYYVVNGTRVHFSEGDDEWGCLCTFPHNDECDGVLTPERVRDLALLGAAVAMIATRRLDGEWAYLPAAVPEWIREEIMRLVPSDEPAA